MGAVVGEIESPAFVGVVVGESVDTVGTVGVIVGASVGTSVAVGECVSPVLEGIAVGAAVVEIFACSISSVLVQYGVQP